LHAQINTSFKMKSFSELGLSESLMRVLPEMGFENPSPIQEEAIPLLKEKAQDFIGLAQTGTGKTAAFGLPLLDWIDSSRKETQALVLAPTRELGQQIASQLALFAKYLPNIQTQAVYGGASIVAQMRDIKRRTPQIVIATPGRLLDLMRRKSLDLSAVKFVVLDEADEMLNMGFKEDIDDILSYTGDNKNTWLFSATMPKEIRSIVKSYMKDPVEVKVSVGNQGNENIEHQYALVNSSNKFEGLQRILDSEEGFRGVIFCRTRAATQQLADNLKKNNYQAEALHGEMSQVQRDRVMKRFKDHTLQVLVATDVAARGIDVNDLTHVVHYSLPDEDAYYTHRSGRTARAGKKGISLSILTNRDMRKLNMLEKKLKLKMSKITIPSAKDLASKKLYTWAQSILDTPSSKEIDGKILTDVQMLLGALSYEELVEKLVSIQLQSLNYSKSNKDLNADGKSERRSTRGDRNDRGGDRRDRRDSRDRGDRRARPERSERVERTEGKKADFKGDRFFINVGKQDDVTKRDLVEFITDTASVRRGDIGDIDIQGNCAFFEIDKKYSKKISNSFKGIFIDGREIRVNRDSQ
jgi:ATP-dependent RNA helicase DeaD